MPVSGFLQGEAAIAVSFGIPYASYSTEHWKSMSKCQVDEFMREQIK